jgi:hypothetical protein
MTPDGAWYHIMLTTSGDWLYGDARGFRTRHHREHVEGDYKNPPPPGIYENGPYHCLCPEDHPDDLAHFAPSPVGPPATPQP